MDLLGCQNKRCQKKIKNDQSEQVESKHKWHKFNKDQHTAGLVHIG